MKYWIRDEENTPQRFPLKLLIQTIIKQLGSSKFKFWIHRSQGYGLKITEWDKLLDNQNSIEVDQKLLENISVGTEEWFYDLEVEVTIENNKYLWFGLHDSTALFIDAPKEFVESVIKSFKIVQRAKTD
jgi:hypothetical protein